jgi:hypothetical protein
VVQFEIHGLVIGFGLWETGGMKKPELKITVHNNGVVPVEGTCTACPSEKFRVNVPKILDRSEALSDLTDQFKRHCEQVHMREDATRLPGS